jgi:hypothetical protein
VNDETEHLQELAELLSDDMCQLQQILKQDYQAVKEMMYQQVMWDEISSHPCDEMEEDREVCLDDWNN